MLTKTKIVGLSLCAVSLSACMMGGGQGGNSDYQSYNYENTPLYPEGYESTAVYDDRMGAGPGKDVVVPESYHVGAMQSPISPKNLDKSWVNSQNPMAYTIQIASDEQASRVASTLQKAPKSERMAEVKSQRNGKTNYIGLYGSYPSSEAAQQALNALPEDIKQGAGITSWGSVQQTISD